MKRTVFVALFTLCVSTLAWAADRTNLEIFNDVSKQVTRYSYFTIFDSVHADVKDGVVTLTGRVTLPYKADDIARRVAKVDGVTKVNNRIEALPVSQFDNSLRRQIASAIYSHPALFQYGVGADPSIHIIVEHGRVTLDGVVNNDADRAIARMVASSFGSFGQVKNALQTKEEAKQAREKI
jgi:hyperosmotically inducible protein